jgi:2'-hydroxyisoflavone reductase
VQFVDARDLAAWIVRSAEGGPTGAFNATGPAAPLTMGRFLEAAAEAVRPEAGGAPAEGVAPAPPPVPVWIPDDFLAAHDVSVWTGLPFWIPAGHEGGNFLRADASKAIAAGLTFRPVAETVRDTLAWHRVRPDVPPDGTGLAAGLAPDDEAALLAAWAQAGPPAAPPRGASP